MHTHTGEEVVELFNEMPATQGQFLEGAFKFSGKLIGGMRAGQMCSKNVDLHRCCLRVRCAFTAAFDAEYRRRPRNIRMSMSIILGSVYFVSY